MKTGCPLAENVIKPPDFPNQAMLQNYAMETRDVTGFVQVLENLESPGILLYHFPGLESPGKRLLVLENSGNLFSSSTKYEMYGRQ